MPLSSNALNGCSSDIFEVWLDLLLEQKFFCVRKSKDYLHIDALRCYWKPILSTLDQYAQRSRDICIILFLKYCFPHTNALTVYPGQLDTTRLTTIVSESS